MVAQLTAERDFRGAGCDERCEVVKAIVPGRFGRSELLLHDPATHEQYGRILGRREPRDSADSAGVLVTGTLTIEFDRAAVTVEGSFVNLTPVEWRIVSALAHRAGHLCPPDVLIRDVWGANAWMSQHILRANLSRIRGRLGSAGGLIRTRPGLGYELLMVEAGAVAPPRERHGGMPLSGRWSLKWDACRACDRTDRAHSSRGYCTRCRPRARESGQRAASGSDGAT